jgi:hypothetical protein
VRRHHPGSPTAQVEVVLSHEDPVKRGRHLGPPAGVRACPRIVSSAAPPAPDDSRAASSTVTRAHPPVMATALAAQYCGFGSSRGLLSAFRRGKVFPVGRRGGTGTFTWRREDLDSFLRGEEPIGGAALALSDRADAASGYLTPEDGRLLRDRSRDRPAAPCASLARREPHDLGHTSRPGPASMRRARPREGNDPIVAALERLRRVVAGGEGR